MIKRHNVGFLLLSFPFLYQSENPKIYMRQAVNVKCISFTNSIWYEIVSIFALNMEFMEVSGKMKAGMMKVDSKKCFQA